MSRQSSRDRTNTLLESSDALAVISEELMSPKNASKSELDAGDVLKTSFKESKPAGCPASCSCKVEAGVKFSPEEVEAMLKEKEDKLKAEFARELESDMSKLKERFDFILQNEQVRASYMLREAHRERQEKVQALQTQLECKNLAGLMYVLCSERRKCKLEKLKMVEDYTNYIHNLQDILSEGQLLILHLSRGYKTAARVDHEWREKMKKVIKEFQEYVYHFAGGSPDTNQYVFDIPALLKTEAAIENDPEEDPCTCLDEEETVTVLEPEKSWWEQLDDDGRPFVVFGDMASFNPPQRREVLKAVKAAKTAPAKWKEYVFNEMLLQSGCPTADTVKDVYPERTMTERWVCHGALQDQDSNESRLSSRRYTTTSADMKAAMGSMLRMITTSSMGQASSHRANILAARDSMEIASTTRLREKTKDGSKSVSISIGVNKTSVSRAHDDNLSGDSELLRSTIENISKIEEEESSTRKGLGSIHNDSLQVIPGHVPDKDHRINYEKICPMDKCQRMQVDSFTRALPSYMRASPFTHFQHTFDDYETCSKEQLEVLRHRIAVKASRSRSRQQLAEDPLEEWAPDVEGVGVQTSDMSLLGLPPCSCRLAAPSPSPAASAGRIFNVEDLIPMKEALDTITKECFHDDRIVFDRFKVIGQEDSSASCHVRPAKHSFKQVRMMEINKILKQHPSLLDLFQGNTQC